MNNPEFNQGQTGGVVPSSSPRPKRSIGKWILLGLALALGLPPLVGMLLQTAADRVLGNSGNARVTQLARIVARPLIPEGTKKIEPSDAEVLALIQSKTATAKKYAETHDDFAPISMEYASALSAFMGIADQAPSPQPLIQAGLQTLKGSLADDNGAFFLGLLGMGSELNELSRYSDKLSMIHSRMVACRIRLAELVMSEGRQESSSAVFSWQFFESGRLGSVTKEDTLKLRNVSGILLNHCLVITELTGKAGDHFTNLFFIDAWAPEQALLAVAPSGPIGRETVRQVSQVRVRVLSDERTSALSEWSAAR